MTSLPLDPAEWTYEHVEDHFNARYIAIASLTLMIWDHLTTLDLETEYIWNTGAGVTLNKSLFCVIRYFTTIAFGSHCLALFIARPSYEVCQGLIVFGRVASFGFIGVCDLLLLLRTWAIYNRTRKSLICLVVLLVVTYLPTIVVGVFWLLTLRLGPSELYPVIPGCFFRTINPVAFWPVILPSVVYNTVLSGASMYKIWSYHQTQINAPLISLLIRDGMVYYVIILTVYLCNGFFLLDKRLFVVTIEGRFVIGVVTVTCAQMQLNLRTAVYHVPDYVTTYYRQQDPVVGLNSRINPPRRPGIDTLIFGGTATELDYEHHNSSTESEVEQKGRRGSHVVELVTTSQGKKNRITVPSVRFPHAGNLKPASLLPQLRRANSFHGLPSHSVDIIVTPNATTDEVFPGLPPTKTTHSELSDRSLTRANTVWK